MVILMPSFNEQEITTNQIQHKTLCERNMPTSIYMRWGGGGDGGGGGGLRGGGRGGRGGGGRATLI